MKKIYYTPLFIILSSINRVHTFDIIRSHLEYPREEGWITKKIREWNPIAWWQREKAIEKERPRALWLNKIFSAKESGLESRLPPELLPLIGRYIPIDYQSYFNSFKRVTDGMFGWPRYFFINLGINEVRQEFGLGLAYIQGPQEGNLYLLNYFSNKNDTRKIRMPPVKKIAVYNNYVVCLHNNNDISFAQVRNENSLELVDNIKFETKKFEDPAGLFNYFKLALLERIESIVFEDIKCYASLGIISYKNNITNQWGTILLDEQFKKVKLDTLYTKNGIEKVSALFHDAPKRMIGNENYLIIESEDMHEGPDIYKIIPDSENLEFVRRSKSEGFVKHIYGNWMVRQVYQMNNLVYVENIIQQGPNSNNAIDVIGLNITSLKCWDNQLVIVKNNAEMFFYALLEGRKIGKEIRESDSGKLEEVGQASSELEVGGVELENNMSTQYAYYLGSAPDFKVEYFNNDRIGVVATPKQFGLDFVYFQIWKSGFPREVYRFLPSTMPQHSRTYLFLRGLGNYFKSMFEKTEQFNKLMKFITGQSHIN